MKKYAASVLVWAALCTEPALTLADDLGSACLSHFTVQGSFFTGKKYNTWAQIPGVSMADTYARIYAAIVKDGWVINQADIGSGVISAAEQVSYGKGAQAPLTILVEAAGGDSKATMTFRTAGGQSAAGDLIRNRFCNYIESAASARPQ